MGPSVDQYSLPSVFDHFPRANQRVTDSAAAYHSERRGRSGGTAPTPTDGGGGHVVTVYRVIDNEILARKVWSGVC